MANHLILIKHSMPLLDPAVPPNRWPLSDAGRARCQSLAAALSPYAPDVLVSSTEVKAIQTSRLVGAELGLTPMAIDGIEEQQGGRDGLPDWSVIQDGVRRFYTVPDQAVFGTESANQVYDRYNQAVEQVVAANPGRTVAAVTHGVSLINYVSRKTGAEPYDLWSRLSTPSFVVLSLPDLQLVTVVEKPF